MTTIFSLNVYGATTSSVFMHSSRNAQNDHSRQQSNATKGESRSVEKKQVVVLNLCLVGLEAHVREEEGAAILKLKSCPGL